jgi:hypothetical protein
MASVARSCPSLWTFIDFCYLRFAREGLILAKNLPLIVWYKEDLINPLNSVLDLFSRSQGIDVSVHAEDWAKAWEKFASSPAPYLRGLSLELLDWKNKMEAVSLPDTNLASNLVWVSLARCTVSWASLQGCRLRALKLFKPSQRPTIAILRSVLASLQQLEILSLREFA